ncbi:MAG: hypothetical protein RTU92_06720 [Candidatus Thorarchaeota archaeon]
MKTINLYSGHYEEINLRAGVLDFDECRITLKHDRGIDLLRENCDTLSVREGHQSFFISQLIQSLHHDQARLLRLNLHAIVPRVF